MAPTNDAGLAPVAAGAKAQEKDRLAGSINSESTASLQKLQPCHDFLLSALRCLSLRLRLIVAEVDSAGVAFRGGMISPEDAVAWAEEVAPGCLGVVAESIWGGANG